MFNRFYKHINHKKADMRNLNLPVYFRNISFALLAVLLFAGRGNAQTDINIGTGTAGNTNTTYPSPLQDYFEGARSQYLYTAAELTAAGMAPGNIVAIKFDVQALATTTVANPQFQIEQFTLSIGSSSATSLSATTWEPGTSPVFGPVDYMAVLGPNTFTLTSPFVWNGVDNIIIEICNGDPNSTSAVTYTGNPVIPWTTGLTFNASHTYRADNEDNLCGTTSTANTGTLTTRPNIIFSWIPATACSGAPTAGSANASLSSVCNPTTSFTVTVSGSTAASGLTYQWQSSLNNTAWSDIPSATNSALFVTGINVNTYYRRQIKCGSNTSFSTSVLVTATPATYATLPFTESFESSWVSVCNTNDAPNTFWRNSPATGNNSWRREDDGATAAWGNAGLGLYAPNASQGSHSARWHSYQATAGSKGQLDLYVNAATPAANKSLTFDYINTTGTDSLVVSFSSNGGATFTRLDSSRASALWRTKTLYFNSTSANTIVRFECTGDFGTTDIGLDNIILTEFANCSGTPVGGTTVTTVTSVCNPTTPIPLTVTGATNAALLTFQWEMSINGGTSWSPIPSATAATYTSPGVSVNTMFRRVTTCAAVGTPSTPVTITTNAPAYATVPFSESFESTWLDGCDLRDIPNNFWRNSPLTGNNSWRRNDDAAAAAWVNPNNGVYTPSASDGSSSARFHSYQASSGTKGQLNLYINCATSSAVKRLKYDHINTSGTDSLSVLISTNGGTSFTRIDGAFQAAAWTTHEVVFTSSAANTIIRFETTSDFGVTDIGLDNVTVTDFPPCSGTPVGGTATSTSVNICPSVTFTVSVTGSTDASGLTYQWQQSINGGTSWGNIGGATSATYTSPGITVPTSFRRQILCGAASAFSAPVDVALNAPVYATIPYLESFENTWANSCNTRDIPNNFWRNNPGTGNNSWRRVDDGASAAWGNVNLGMYTPASSVGSYSARFHSYQAADGTTGDFTLYVNLNTGANAKKLTFDYINTSGDDSLTIELSNDGGVTFIRLDSTFRATSWTQKTIFFSSVSSTAVLRFHATSDFGVTDIGLDNINLINWADCAGAPNGGTATTSLANVCTEPFTLNASGVSTGNGISYQWQKSTDNINWVPIPGATNFTYTTNQVGTTWYRLVTTCSFSSTSSNSTSVQVVSPLPANGVYTINSAAATNIPARTFQTFNDAYTYIKCGIDGAVVFNVINGPYNEQLTMNAVPGASSTKTITFKGNGTAAIGFGSTNTNERAVIKLKGANFIILDSLIINANTGTYGYGVQLMSDADSNIVRNCIINSSLTSTAQNYAGIVINGTDVGPIALGIVLCDYNTFDRNTINGGFYGATLYATFTAGASGNNNFTNNNFKDFYQYGMYVGGSYNTLIEGNRFSRPTRASVAEFQGIHFATQKNTGCIVSKNRIYNPFGGALTSTSNFYGIHFNASDGSVGAENFVTNNLIYNVNGNGPVFGIANTGSDYVGYFHNTISLDHATSTATGTTRGFYQTTAASGLFFFNNIISITRGGTGAKHAIYLGTAALAAADNNDYYVNAAAGTNFVGFLTANRATLADWIANTPHDDNSLSAIPAYVDAANENYTPGNAGINDKGIDVGITTDIVNAPRTAPDMGAYEFTPPACSTPPVNGTTSLSAAVICQNEIVVLKLNIGPYGSGQTFQWQTSPTLAGTYTNLGTPLLTPDTSILSNVTLYYRAAVSCGSTTVFSNPILLTVNPALPSATYTINKGSATTYVPGVPGGNFASFAAANSAMDCGIFGGPVVFNVVAGSGPYTEQLRLDSIKGTSVVNTITFNGLGNTITFNPTNSNERAVVKLDSTDHVIFDSLTIDASGTGTYGYGVQLINNADSNVFRKCTILSSLTNTSTNFAGVVINAASAGPITTGNTFCDFNLFDRNTISGGYYGISVVGSTTAASFIDSNRFTNNTIKEFYNTGIYVAGTARTLIEGNTFSRPARTNTAATVYGVQVTTAISNRLEFLKTASQISLEEFLQALQHSMEYIIML